MAHEIERNDKVVLHKHQAWHGLGLVVDEAPTPREALTLAGLEWGVEQRPLYVKEGNELVEVDSHIANYRADTGERLGVVSAGYVPIQNIDMADFCEALAEQSVVKCESVGSIRNGRRVWFLLKGEQFNVAMDDAIYPYVCVSNGHDGTSSFRVTPTTIRVVCSNTLHCVIPSKETGELASAAFAVRHTKNIMDRVFEAKQALKQYGKAVEEFKELASVLSHKNVSREDVQSFFLECYTHTLGEIPSNPQDAKEERRRNKAMSAFDSFSRRFDDERKIAGASLWNAFNAFSGLVQHDRKARGKDDADRVARRVESNLFGLSQDRTQTALAIAYKALGS